MPATEADKDTANPKPTTMPGASADTMGNMNPERLQRLRRSPSNEELVYQSMDGSPLPRKSSAKSETQAPVPASVPASVPAPAPAPAPASVPARPPAANSSARATPAHPPNGNANAKMLRRVSLNQVAAARARLLGAKKNGGRPPLAGADANARAGNAEPAAAHARPGNAQPVVAHVRAVNPQPAAAQVQPGNAQPVVARAQQLPVVLKQEPVVLPSINEMTGVDRPPSLHVVDDGTDGSKPVPPINVRCRPIVQHGGALPYEINADTQFLEGMLGYHRFRLTVQPWAAKVGSMTYSRIVTHAGLHLHQFLRAETSIPVLALPRVTSSSAAGDPTVAGTMDQTIRGQVLEEVWSSLSPTVKFSIARQLRRIVTAMRAVGADRADRLLGSARSGPWSIIMDRHRSKTYWAIQDTPTHYSFVSFLQATFDPSVPRTISNALFRQFQGPGTVGEEYALVLAHGEIAPRSIVIDNNKIVAVLGWNCAGWYPEWWDYAKFFETGTRAVNRDWYDYASEIFDKEYPAELAAYQGFVRCQKP